jgi:hypothetical protein
MNGEHKDRFLQTMAAKPFAEMAAKPEFQAALDAALLEYATSQSVEGDFTVAAAAHYRLDGARHFVSVFRRMGIKDTMPTPEVVGHLKGNI